MKTLLLYLAFISAVCAAHSASETMWETVSAESAKIAVPVGWRTLDRIQATMLIYRQGDGIGVPVTDEIGAPLQIGLTLEKFPPSEESIESTAKELARKSTTNPELEMVGKESIEAIKLSDDTAATLVTTEFIKARSRRSLYMKLIGKDNKGQVWIATGYLVSGKNSQWPKPNSKLATWLRTHLVSLTLTGKNVDQKLIEAAYEKRDQKEDSALNHSSADRFGVTGTWTGSWRDPQRNSSEAFSMVLVQRGTNLTGTAVFMDGNGTTAEVAGQATGSSIQLLMSAPNDAIPKTTWMGTLTNETVSGIWHLHGKANDGYASTGHWSATRKK